MRKVIFLDIDGVLNCRTTKQRTRGFIGLEPRFIKRFYALVKKTGAEVILSSSWRIGEKWKENLAIAGFDVTILKGRTPANTTLDIRGEEIDLWLSRQREPIHYAIIDDDSRMLPHQPLFRTDWEKGLTKEICHRVFMHLSTPKEFIRVDKGV